MWMNFFYKLLKFLPSVFYFFFIALLAILTLPFLSPDIFPDPFNWDFSEYAYSILSDEPESYSAVTADEPEDFTGHGYYYRISVIPGEQDLILAAFRDPSLREMVLDFFIAMTGSRELASVILNYAAEFNIQPSLAFSLCWEESRYNPRAVNKTNRNSTVDRGLFQLNSASFPKLTEEDFFNPAINAYYGLAHLKYCLETAGTEVAGLAMYNAGASRVRSGGTPKMTLDYISRIMKKQRQIEELFLFEYSKPVEIVLPQEQPAGFSLSLLSPLGKS